MATIDAEKVVAAAAREMALADGNPGTARVLREYRADARASLLGGLKEAKRQGWEVSDLLAALASVEPTKARGEA